MEFPVLGVTLLEAKIPLPSSRHHGITEQSRLKGTVEVSSVTPLPSRDKFKDRSDWSGPSPSPGMEMLGVALKIPESIMLLLINALRCLTEIQNTVLTWRAISVTAKVKESQSSGEVHMYYLPQCFRRTINRSAPKPAFNLLQWCDQRESAILHQYCITEVCQPTDGVFAAVRRR